MKEFLKEQLIDIVKNGTVTITTTDDGNRTIVSTKENGSDRLKAIQLLLDMEYREGEGKLKSNQRDLPGFSVNLTMDNNK